MTNPNPGFQRQKRAGLQVPAGLSPDLARFLQGLKEAVQSSQGTLGQPQERFVSVSELERLGVVRSVLKGGRAELRRVDDVDAAGNGTPAVVEDDGPAISDSGAQDRDFLIYNAVQGEWLPFGLFDEDVDWFGQHDFVDSDADQVRVGYNGSDGYIALSRGSGTTAPGYARFYDASGVSRGYVGNHDSASRITFTSENGWGIRFESATDARLDATAFTVNAPTTIAGTAPKLYLNETDADADEKYWSIDASAGALRFRAWNDLLNVSETFFDIARTGTNIDGFTFAADVLAFAGYSIFSGALEFQNATPSMLFVQTTGAADNKVWRAGVVNESFRISAVNDLASVTTNAILIDRTGTTIDEIELNATLLDFNADMDLSGLIIVGDVVRLPHRSAPGSPTNGDMWTTTAGLFVRINGVTVGPLGAGSGTGSVGYPQQLGYAGI